MQSLSSKFQSAALSTVKKLITQEKLGEQEKVVMREMREKLTKLGTTILVNNIIPQQQVQQDNLEREMLDLAEKIVSERKDTSGIFLDSNQFKVFLEKVFLYQFEKNDDGTPKVQLTKILTGEKLNKIYENTVYKYSQVDSLMNHELIEIEKCCTNAKSKLVELTRTEVKLLKSDMKIDLKKLKEFSVQSKVQKIIIESSKLETVLEKLVESREVLIDTKVKKLTESNPQDLIVNSQLFNELASELNDQEFVDFLLGVVIEQ
jgi:hypothetical protein